MSRLRYLLPVSGFFLLFTVAPLAAQPQLLPPRFDFAPTTSFDASIPTPADFLGYELGTRFTLYADVVAYIKALAAASDRVTLHEYGRTHEDRPLHYLVVTLPDHHARIDEIRRNNLRLADPQALSDGDAETLLADHPIITWLSYNVHGNEASTTEAVMQVAYHLAAAQDPDVTALLRQSVVILDPCINPDGRDRYAYWYRSMQSHVLNLNVDDIEHDEPWPGGRTNHYWFDLNRDWVWLVHPESQGRIAAYQQWLPQVHVDYHEQGFNANYFTMPGTTPRNLLLPDDYEGWSDAFGRGNIAEFDQRQINYFTREAFDFFYPGYGSSYPSTMGAIGMLTEQGGGSRGARAVETEDGYVLTLRQRVFDHYITSLAAIKTAADNRDGLLRYFRNTFSQAANKGDAAAYVFPDDPERSAYLYDVIDMLMKHGARVERADAAFTVSDARDYWDDAPRRRSFEAGTYLVFTDQPRHLFINTVLQRQMAIEDSVMYDMATWSAPLAYNLDAFWTTSKPGVATTPLDRAPAPRANVINPNAGYAYVIDWRQRNAPKALAKLWEAGYRVRAARKGFGDGTRDFPPGTLIVLLGRNQGKPAQADMERIAQEGGVVIIGMNTGRMETGIDLASRDSRPVKKPKTALLVDAPFNAYTAGQLWYLFDQETGLGISRLRVGELGDTKLSEYDVMIIPGTRGPLSAVIDSVQVQRLKAWVEAGGTLIATEGSARALTKNRLGLTDVELASDQKDEATDEIPSSAYTTYAARGDSTGLDRIPGSALRGWIDQTHPIAFGLPDRLYSLKFDTDALLPSDDLETVGYYDRDVSTLLTAGYASQKNLRTLAGNAFAAVREMGEGRVVFLLDNTQYRMFWIGPARMMQNAVMLAPGM